MMLKSIRIGLLVTFLTCYVDFGHDGGSFIGQIEWSLLNTLNDLFDSIQVSFVALAFIGQLLLVIAIFWTRYSKRLTLVSVICLSVVVLSIAALGLLTDFKTALSTIPFIAIVILYISKRHLKETKTNEFK